MWAHPIFSVAGILTFSSELLETFWLGETFWHGALPDRGAARVLVPVTTLIAFLATLLTRWDRHDPRRVLEAAGWAAALGMALAMAAFSVLTDFTGVGYPSPDYPYLTSGRLATAALVPFLLSWLAGLDRLGRGLGSPRISTALVGVTLLALAWQSVAGILRTAPSAFNWFHLP